MADNNAAGELMEHVMDAVRQENLPRHAENTPKGHPRLGPCTEIRRCVVLGPGPGNKSILKTRARQYAESASEPVTKLICGDLNTA